MARFNFALAVVAFAAGAAAQCTDSSGYHLENATWTGGLSGCASFTCLNKVIQVKDSCKCTFADGNIGTPSILWIDYSKCTQCKCIVGTPACEPLAGCVTVTTTVSASVTVTVPAPPAPITSCAAPGGLTLKIGDVYNENCLTCVCTSTVGLSCRVADACIIAPPPPAPIATGCSVPVGRHRNIVIPNGSFYRDVCRNCACNAGTLSCTNICVLPTPVPTPPPPPTPVPVPILDCHVGGGYGNIVLNGQTIVKRCKSCKCTNGVFTCVNICTGGVTLTHTATATIAPPPVVCIKADGTEIAEGDSYTTTKCKMCTCMDGVFVCEQVCTIAPADCKNSKGKAVSHGATVKDSCKTCTCNDGKYTCKGSCPAGKCKAPCSKCTCSSGKWACKNLCPIPAPCTCEDGTKIASGRSWSNKCKKCKCGNGKLTCKAHGKC